MKNFLFLLITFGFTLVGFTQSTVALWNYNTIVGAPASPTADIGTGSSQVIGSMVVATAATGMDPVINNGCGAQNGLSPGAWAFTATPGLTNESSGVQYNASTVGIQNILFTWDQRWSNTAANTIRLQYTLDGTTWTNFTMTTANTTFCNGSIDNGRFQNNGVGDQYRRIKADFSAITGANNNANFGVRILAANYQTTTEFRQTSNPALIATGGTWRFDNVSIQGGANVSIAAASNFAQYNESIGSINVPITVSNANSAPINLTFSLSVYSDATDNVDYTWTNTLTIPANTNGVTNLPITIVDDILAEKAERIIVKISGGTNAFVSAIDNYQIIFIKDNDYVAPVATNELNLNLLTSYSNGVSGTNSAEIVAFDPTVDRLYIVNSIAGKLDIVNFANPSTPVAITSINLSTYGGINSIVAHNGVVACAIESVPAQNNGKVVFFDANGVYINQVEVGAMPDMITFNKTFTKILTANEGEPDGTYANDPVGSVSIIDLTPGYASLTNSNVTNVGFTAYNGQETTLRAQGIRVFSTSASVAQDFEPEYIAISDDNTKAYVTLQENNALVTIDLATSAITSLAALGYSSYSAGSGNAMDASDQSGAVLITGNLPIKGAYMPDAMTFKTINGQGLLFTANEGDSREFGSVVDANRISSSTFNNVLDATAFPDQSILRNNKFLGRLSALKYSGDTDGDGDYDELHVMGGRSFSIWNPLTGALVYDSKDLIEQITANHPTFGAIFNASNTTGTPALKNRSDDKGPEPEGVAVATINGSTYAFVALERIGGAMMFNVDIPTSPVFVGYANNRSTTVSGPDLGAEGIIFISAADSPNNKALLILANEVSSTLSIYQINSCADLSGGSITSNDLSLCPGQTTSLSVTNVSGVSYQWLLNGAVIANATNNTYQANQVGNIAVKVTNSSLGCTDTTAVVAITSVAAPNVSAGQDQTVCGGTTVSLTASGANSYSWNNGATGSTLTILAGNTTSSINYIVTGLDNTTGCTKKDTVVIQVNGLPLINAGTDFQVCSNDTVTLSATGGTSYVWNNGIINNQAFVLSNTSTFNVTGSDANGCINSDEITVIVNQSPQLNVGNDITVCLNNAPVQLTAISNEGGLTYSWSTGASTQQISVNSSSVYSATVTNSFGCSSSDSVEVIVNELPSLNLGQDQSVCSDELPATLNAQSTSTGLVYNWSTNQNTQQIQVSLTGTYSVSVIDQNGCESTDEVAVQVLNSPNVNAGQDITVCANEFPVTLNATGNGSQVEWSTGAQTPFTTVNGAGTYTVTTTAQNGCQASDDVVVTSDPCASLVEQNDGILIYPNPTTSMVTILNKTTLPLNYCLRTIEGKIVFQGELDSSSEKTSIDLINLSNGAYLIQLFNTEFNYTTRITKQ
ncbi:MAG: choice-of-anchor I family protein [Crocinitomicaceae bacterium]|nr:choice-of-anchor I family protein [Crocinitomicaceae bacterium]